MTKQLAGWSRALMIGFLSLQFSACSRQPETTNQPAKPPEAKDQTYRTLGGQSVISFVSADELEIREGGANFVCKYTKQDNKLRVVVNALGTTTAKYYDITPQGLVGEQGEVFYEPATYQKLLIEAQVRATKLTLNALSTSIDLYEVDTGIFPPSLSSLLTDDGSTNWKGPYVKVEPKDAWGMPFTYQLRDGVFNVLSNGPDGRPGTSDDIKIP